MERAPRDGGATFPEGAAPAGAVEGRNGGGDVGYTGPCPPIPLDPHRYMFTFHAVDAVLDLPEGATRAELEAALDGHVLATAALTGLYARPLPVPLP